MAVDNLHRLLMIVDDRRRWSPIVDERRRPSTIVHDHDFEVEVADGVKVRVVQSTLADVRSKTEPANDA